LSFNECLVFEDDPTYEEIKERKKEGSKEMNE
jgi:hypothetical protein